MEGFIPHAYCGLYCAACPNYQKTKSGEIPLEDEGSCKGCKSDTVTGSWCSQCTLKNCARQKGVEFCVDCNEYPCQDLVEFKEDPQYPYHNEVFTYGEIIKKDGKEAWLKQMKKRWSCDHCGKTYDWWTLRCHSCGQTVEGYQNPQEA